MSLPVAPYPHLQFFDNDGNPLNGGLLYTFLAGSTTPQSLYYDPDLSVGHACPNPVVLNSAGRPQVSGGEVNLYMASVAYKFVLKTSGGVTLWTSDFIAPYASALVLPTTFAVGDILYADTTTTLAKLADVAAGSYLRSGGVSTAPAWSTATLPNTATTGDILYASAANTYSNLAASTSGFVLTAQGAGVAPAWAAAAAVDKSIVQGRLSLTTAVPVTTTDVTAATTLYWALYGGNQISLYTGSAWTTVSISQLSITLVGLTASKPYDVFIDYNAGTPILELVVWTNDTTRATALALQDGVLVQTGDADSRYVGTIYTDAAGGAVTDSYSLRHVWNYYNRVPRVMRVMEATNSWTYGTSTFRQARASTANQLDFVVGVSEVAIQASVAVSFQANNAGDAVIVGIGINSTTTPETGNTRSYASESVTGQYQTATTRLDAFAAPGRSTAVWLEYAAVVATATFYGDDGGVAIASGISGVIWG